MAILDILAPFSNIIFIILIWIALNSLKKRIKKLENEIHGKSSN